MLDNLDLKQELGKKEYESQIETLMQQLRSLQKTCWERKLPVVVVLEGWAAAGKGALVKQMVNYMDPRGFHVHPVWPPTEEEQQYPFLWRFWEKLPVKGSMSFFYHSWYTRVLEDRLFGRVKGASVPLAMQQINAFERQLVDDGVAVVKFWIHLSRKELKDRLKSYGRDRLLSWRVRPEDWQQAEDYQHYTKIAEDMIMQTSTGHSPWTLIEGNDQKWAQVRVLTKLCTVLTAALDNLSHQTVVPPSPPQEHLYPTEPDLLAQIDLNASLSKEEYKKQLQKQQLKLLKLQMKMNQERVPVLVLFEGWDAAGKGGAIKRLTDVLDPRSYQVRAFSAPTDEEKAHHYLWRFWRRLPPAGTIGICDRSWYGRVLVERVEGFAKEAEWRRAYREINEFEAQLTSAGYVLVKIWLHISPEVQLQRFQEREANTFKEYKLTAEDWRNREKWNLYEVAVNQAIERTSTPNAPWTIIPANDKYYARVKTIEAVTEALKAKFE